MKDPPVAPTICASSLATVSEVADSEWERPLLMVHYNLGAVHPFVTIRLRTYFNSLFNSALLRQGWPAAFDCVDAAN